MGNHKFVILGCLHSGVLDNVPSLSEALNAPIHNKMWGCENHSQRLISGKWKEHPYLEISIGGCNYRFFRHPDLYMIPHIQTLVNKINYNEQNNICVPYDEVNAKYHDARNVYNLAYNAGVKMKEVLRNG